MNHASTASNPTDLHLVIVSGFGGDRDIADLEDAITEKIHPTDSHIIRGCPPHRALHHPQELVSDIREQIRSIATENILIVGHSYGALLALAASTRMDMQGIIKLILIDGPLNIDQPVRPTKLTHRLFFKQYNYRPRLAMDCIDYLKRHGSKGIITIASLDDRIVPFETKSLPSFDEKIKSEKTIRQIVQETSDNGATFLRPVGGNKSVLNLTLPLRYYGHRLEPKIPIIASIIEQLTPTELIQPEHSRVAEYLK